MKRTVWTFGLIAGGVSAVMMVATLPFVDRIGFERAAVLGYTMIALSGLFVFFGIRSNARTRVLDPTRWTGSVTWMTILPRAHHCAHLWLLKTAVAA